MSLSVRCAIKGYYYEPTVTLVSNTWKLSGGLKLTDGTPKKIKDFIIPSDVLAVELKEGEDDFYLVEIQLSSRGWLESYDGRLSPQIVVRER